MMIIMISKKCIFQKKIFIFDNYCKLTIIELKSYQIIINIIEIMVEFIEMKKITH